MATAITLRKADRRVMAIAASAAAHAGLFVLFAWRLGETPPRAEPPVMVVQLTPWPKRAAEPETREPPRRAEPSDRRRAQVAARPSRPPPPGVAAPPPAPFAPADDVAGRQALRGLLDCRPMNLDRLSPEARERCERKLAGDPSLRSAGGPRLNLDVSGKFAQEDEPYLARRPKKGCKVRAAGGVDPMGKEGPVGGVACAIPF